MRHFFAGLAICFLASCSRGADPLKLTIISISANVHYTVIGGETNTPINVQIVVNDKDGKPVVPTKVVWTPVKDLTIITGEYFKTELKTQAKVFSSVPKTYDLNVTVDADGAASTTVQCKIKIADRRKLWVVVLDKNPNFPDIKTCSLVGNSDFRKALKDYHHYLYIDRADNPDYAQSVHNHHHNLPFVIIMDNDGNVLRKREQMDNHQELIKLIQKLSQPWLD